MPERLLSFSELVDSLCLLMFKAFEENTIALPTATCPRPKQTQADGDGHWWFTWLARLSPGIGNPRSYINQPARAGSWLVPAGTYRDRLRPGPGLAMPVLSGWYNSARSGGLHNHYDFADVDENLNQNQYETSGREAETSWS